MQGKHPYTHKKAYFEKGKINFLDLFAKAIGGPRCITSPGKTHRNGQVPHRVLAAGHKVVCPSLLWWAHEFTSSLREHKWLRQLHLPRVHAGMGDRQRCQSGSLEVCAQFASLQEGMFVRRFLLHYPEARMWIYPCLSHSRFIPGGNFFKEKFSTHFLL